MINEGNTLIEDCCVITKWYSEEYDDGIPLDFMGMYARGEKVFPSIDLFSKYIKMLIETPVSRNRDNITFDELLWIYRPMDCDLRKDKFFNLKPVNKAKMINFMLHNSYEENLIIGLVEWFDAWIAKEGSELIQENLNWSVNIYNGYRIPPSYNFNKELENVR